MSHAAPGHLPLGYRPCIELFELDRRVVRKHVFREAGGTNGTGVGNQLRDPDAYRLRRVWSAMRVDGFLYLMSQELRHRFNQPAAQHDHVRIQKIDQIRKRYPDDAGAAANELLDRLIALAYRIRERISPHVADFRAGGALQAWRAMACRQRGRIACDRSAACDIVQNFLAREFL